MAPVFLSLCWLLLLDHQLGSGAPTPGPVFLSGQAADSVLRRQKRHNSGVFEEFMEGNLERECLEEMCDLEEAREVFENDDKTMEFWARYVDGDQCISNPCQNQGTCKDHHGSYTCTCVPGSTGRNCEIVTSRRCDLNNGGCTHFCEPLATFGATCSCADGYRLAPDGMDCEPSSEFACGRDILTPVISGLSTRSLLANEITIAENETSPRDNSTAASPVTSPAGTTAPPLRQNDLLAASLQTRLWARGDIDGLTKHNIKDLKRIVGGQDVIPGEIPWQVALIARPSGHFFCGGSILSPLWVITAAHCLVEGQGSFFIRVGDYNINTREDTEQNLEVLTEYVHPRYDAALSLYNHDIALLRLQNPINFSSTARPICLGPKAFIEALVKEASPATVSGWGRTRFQGATASTLQKVEVPFTERTECKDSSSARITRYMFCAGYSDVAKDSCQGDSGGPHTNRFHGTWFLTGIVSWGEECAKEGKYGVYTRLSHYNRWIRHVLGTTHHKAEEPNVDEPDA